MNLSATTLAAGAVALLLVFASGPVYRTGVAPLPAAFGAMALGTLVGLLALLIGLGAIVLGARRGLSPSIPLLVGTVLGLVAAVPPLQIIWSARGLPAIHDISTDLTDPPTFDAVLPLRAEAPNGVTFDEAVATRQRSAYPDVRTLRVPAPIDAVFSRAIDAARDAGWEIVTSDQATGRIEATATTRWFGFKDDIVVRLTGAADGTHVDVRSVSRVGRGDLGANAARIRAFLQSLGG